jgi:ABC-2 type transport system ATP-binding protein
VIEYLEFFAAAYRINGAKRRKVCEDALELVGLTYKRDAMATSLSRGMNQRLGLARVLLHDPQVLLLDEPASGLDPRVRIEIRQVIKKLGQMGKTIMVSSHILPELADMCNRIGIIERGELLVNARVDDVMKQVRRQVLLWIGVAVIDGELDRAVQLLSDHPGVDKIEPRDNLLYVTLKEGVTDYSDLPTLLVANGLKLTLFREEELNLETAFMALTKGITS